jgi:hypothetical protein
MFDPLLLPLQLMSHDRYVHVLMDQSGRLRGFLPSELTEIDQPVSAAVLRHLR